MIDKNELDEVVKSMKRHFVKDLKARVENWWETKTSNEVVVAYSEHIKRIDIEIQDMKTIINVTTNPREEVMDKGKEAEVSTKVIASTTNMSKSPG